MRRAERVGEPDAGVEPENLEAAGEIAHERFLAAVEVGDAGDVDPQAVVAQPDTARRLGRKAVSVAVDPVTADPAGEALQIGTIGVRL